MAIPLQISTILDPKGAEQITTENVCSLGIRAVTDHAREQNDRLMISSLKGDMKRLARVVYCQRLSDGHFAVGLEFQGGGVKWASEKKSPGALLAAALGGCFPRFVFLEPEASHS